MSVHVCSLAIMSRSVKRSTGQRNPTEPGAFCEHFTGQPLLSHRHSVTLIHTLHEALVGTIPPTMTPFCSVGLCSTCAAPKGAHGTSRAGLAFEHSRSFLSQPVHHHEPRQATATPDPSTCYCYWMDPMKPSMSWSAECDMSEVERDMNSSSVTSSGSMPLKLPSHHTATSPEGRCKPSGAGAGSAI